MFGIFCMKKLKLWELVAINFYWAGASFKWNSLHPIVLPAILLFLVPDNMKNTYLGLLSFAGLVLAMAIQPISGAASDCWESRWGRRRPLALIGILLEFIFLVMLAWSGNLMILIVGYIGLQIVSNFAQGPMQGLIPDLVRKDQMGVASGIKNLMDMGGLIAASLIAGNLLSPNDRHPTTIMIVVMAVLAVFSAVTFLTVHEKPTSDHNQNHNHIDLEEAFRVDLDGSRDYFRLIGARFLFLTGIYGVQTFVQYYIRDVIHPVNPIQATGYLIGTIGVLLLGCVFLGGLLSDRIGGRAVVAFSSVFAAAGSFLLIFARDLVTMMIFGSILGVGIGFYLSANWTMVNKMAPKADAGKFLGLSNLATAGAGAISKLGGFLIDIGNNASPGHFYGYYGMFFFGGVFALISLPLLFKIRQPDDSVTEQS